MPNYLNPSMGDFRLRSELSPEMALEGEALSRRQRIAELLLRQGLQPIQAPEVKGRFQGRISPWQGVAQLAQAGAGAYMGYKNDQAMSDLGQQYTTGKQAAVKAAMEKMQGLEPKPAVPTIGAAPGAYDRPEVDAEINPRDGRLQPSMGGSLPALTTNFTPAAPPATQPVMSQPGPEATPSAKQQVAMAMLGSPYKEVQHMGGLTFAAAQQDKTQKATQEFQDKELGIRQKGLQEERQTRHEDRMASLEAKVSADQQRSEDTRLGVDQRAQAARDATDARREVALATRAAVAANQNNTQEYRASLQADKLNKSYYNDPVVKNARGLESTMQVLQPYAAERDKLPVQARAVNDEYLMKQYLAVTQRNSRILSMELKDIAALPGLGDRWTWMIQNFFIGKHLPDDTFKEMYGVVANKYLALDEQAQGKKNEVLKRAKALGVPPAYLFGDDDAGR